MLIVGGNGNNNLPGTPVADTILGLHGNDTITGAGGDDTITAGPPVNLFPWLFLPDNDTVYGGTGNDTVYGGYGNDTVYGGANNDDLHGQAGNDRLIGGFDQDDSYGGTGFDTFAFSQGHSPSNNTDADWIHDWSSVFDQIDMPIAGNAGNYVEHATGGNTIILAAAHANAFHNETYVFTYNAVTDRGFLVADLDGNNVYETGVVLEGAGSAADLGWWDIV
jgi:Ca2+-binding RTX toxin-like protein